MNNKPDGQSSNTKFKAFLKSPELCMFVLVIISILIVWSSLSKNNDSNNPKTVPAVTDISASAGNGETTTTVSTSTSVTTSVLSTTSFTETTTAAVTTTSAEESDDTENDDETSDSSNPESTHNSTSKNKQNKKNEQLSPYTNTGYSPNSEFYQQRLSIAGDSIAYGFNAYGFIPYEHNYAQESVSMWNLNGFTFCGGCGLVEAIGYNQPSLLYMSIGMNDVNMNSADTFASQYASVIQQIRSCSPNTVIVVAGISPVGVETSYTSNDVIRDYNSALENAVNSLDSPYVYYFDAYSILCDEYLNLRYDCSAGDGLHLQTHYYEELLSALFNFLDTTSVKDMIE